MDNRLPYYSTTTNVCKDGQYRWWYPARLIYGQDNGHKENKPKGNKVVDIGLLPYRSTVPLRSPRPSFVATTLIRCPDPSLLALLTLVSLVDLPSPCSECTVAPQSSLHCCCYPLKAHRTNVAASLPAYYKLRYTPCVSLPLLVPSSHFVGLLPTTAPLSHVQKIIALFPSLLTPLLSLARLLRALNRGAHLCYCRTNSALFVEIPPLFGHPQNGFLDAVAHGVVCGKQFGNSSDYLN